MRRIIRTYLRNALPEWYNIQTGQKFSQEEITKLSQILEPHYKLDARTFVFDPDNPKIVYIGTGQRSGWKGGVILKYDRDLDKSTIIGSPLTGLPKAVINDIIAFKGSNFNTTILAAANEQGVFKTTNDGKSWEPCSTGINLTYGKASGFIAIPDKPFVIYLFYGSSAVEHWDDKSAYGCIYKSDDYGNTWRKFFPDESIFADVKCMWIDPKDHMKMLIGIQQRKNKNGISFYPCGIHYSDNGGKSWECVLKNAMPTDFAYDPVSGIIFLSCAMASPITYPGKYADMRGMEEYINPGLFASAAGGHSWKNVSGEMDDITTHFENLAINVKNREIYLGTFAGVFKTNIEKLIKKCLYP